MAIYNEMQQEKAEKYTLMFRLHEIVVSNHKSIWLILLYIIVGNLEKGKQSEWYCVHI